MKLSKLLLILACITLISCLYVYQQTEVFRLAYVGQKYTMVFQDLLDKNTILGYNIQKNASLVRISSRVSKFADFQMPENFRLVSLTSPKEDSILTQGSLKRENIVYRIFGVKRQAEARTINPSVTLRVDGERSRTINPSVTLRIDGERSRTINSSIPPKD